MLKLWFLSERVLFQETEDTPFHCCCGGQVWGEDVPNTFWCSKRNRINRETHGYASRTHLHSISSSLLLLMGGRNFTCMPEMHLQKNTEGQHWTDWYLCYTIATAFGSLLVSVWLLPITRKVVDWAGSRTQQRALCPSVISLNTVISFWLHREFEREPVSSSLMNETFLKADKNVEPTWKKIKPLT